MGSLLVIMNMSSISSFSPIPSSPAFSLWNNFTSSSPFPVPFSFNPSLFHFYKNHFHWRPYYFLLLEGNKVAGLLALVNTGKAWVSLPHFSYGGVFLKNNIEFDKEQLINHLVVSIEKGKVHPGFFQADIRYPDLYSDFDKKLYIRSLLPIKAGMKQDKMATVIYLPENRDAFFQQLTSNLRRKIRKAETGNFSVKQGKQELLDDFYPVYVKNMYRLGSPAYGKKFFHNLMDAYEFGEALFFVIYKGAIPVAAAMLMSYNGFWENTWFSTLKKAQKEYVADFLHWQMVKYAMGQKAVVYSFGRSDNEGSVFRYKNHWPAENIPIYEYALNQRFNIKNQKWLAGLWRNIPFPAARFLGPLLVKHIY